MHNTTQTLNPGLDIKKQNWEELAKGLPDHNVHFIRQQQRAQQETTSH
jgi:hypothetical protein